MDFARNEINAGTLRILNKELIDPKSDTEAPAEESKEQPNYGELGQRLSANINDMLNGPQEIVKADALGFGFDSDEPSIEPQPQIQVEAVDEPEPDRSLGF